MRLKERNKELERLILITIKSGNTLFCLFRLIVAILLVVIIMYKKISVFVLGLSILFCGFKLEQREFSYEYEIVLNSNENKDVIKGYLYKEQLIDEYNNLIANLDESLITNAVINNIDMFSFDDCVSKYINGKIVIFVGSAKGDTLKGTLKKSTCDNSNIRVKFFFSKFFVK